MSRIIVVMGLFLGTVSFVRAGARIELRPEGFSVIPGDPPSVVVSPGQTLNVDVFLVDTGNPQGDISFRGIFLVFANSDDDIDYPGIDGVLGNGDDNRFNWVNPGNIGAVFPSLPFTSWVYPLTTSIPAFQITMPDNGEVLIGDVNVTIPSELPALLDVINSNSAAPSFNASAAFGFGGVGDPVTNWQAFDGELTGGQLLFVPEPGMLGIILIGAVAMRQGRCPKSITRWRFDR